MKRIIGVCLSCLMVGSWWGAGAVARADFIVYTLPGMRVPLVLEGNVKSHTGSVVEFTYPGYPSVALNRHNVTVVKAPSRLDEYRRLFADANRSESVDGYLVAAEFALRHGRLREFYESCSAAYKRTPDHPVLQRLIETRKKIKRPVMGFEQKELELRRATKLPSMKVVRSTHYIMLHDIKESPDTPRSRVAKRLQILETVYESFLLKFAFVGVSLEPPTEPMMVLLFSEEADYLRYATQFDPDLQSTAGFWSAEDNISVFFDRGTTAEMRQLTDMMDDLQRAKKRARRTAASRDVAQLANSLDLLVKIAKDEADFEVVSHEATHQLAGNTGLMPREKLGLSWSHEGLASYFETPAGAGWGGVGAINPKRLRGYRKIASDPSRSRLEFLISDYLFDAPDSSQEIVDAYGSAWALTHFLMEAHPLKLVEYYEKCANLSEDPKAKVSRREVIELFEKVFGPIEALEDAFHLHMRGQQSKLERLFAAMAE